MFWQMMLHITKSDESYSDLTLLQTKCMLFVNIMSFDNREVASLWQAKILSKVYINTDHDHSDTRSDQNEEHFTKYFGNNDIDSFTFSEELTVDNCGNVSGIEFKCCLFLSFNIIH